MVDEIDTTETPVETPSATSRVHPWLLLVGGMCICLAIGSAVLGLKPDPVPLVTPQPPQNPTVSVLQGGSAEKFWAETVEQQLKKQSQALSDLQHTVTGLQETKATETSLLRPLTVNPVSTVLMSNTLSSQENHDTSPLIASGIEISTVELKPLSPKPQKNADSFVPAGTFVQAVMLGAADASAGVMSQANPSPMLFRLVADGTLPHHAHSHLKDCVVTAAVIGDISSERGHVRLERLSCTFPNGEIVEQPVEGTVFALDAKNGVRGHPVWREGALLARATFAGALSGLAGSLTSLTTAATTPTKGNPVAGLGDTLLKTTGAQGASTAMEKLAQYHIQRAEQYHPVIQLSAGQTVDVVFLKGFYLDGGKHEDTAVSAHTEPELFADSEDSAVEDATGLTLTPAQIEKIKQHEAALGWEVGKT